ncbi:sulfotransferase family protein [Phenylobacterium sp.]|uniref:sulfotransferase family protein n=1 Tax=Phenylobacterium sp. TaxID=1871053 RepID=UPI002FE16127
MTTQEPDSSAAPQTARQSPARTAYLVLGMHRSGTSAVTQLLALAGAHLPEHVMPGDEHNAKGYFEPWKIALFNDERLRAAGSAWDDVFAFPHRPLARKDERAWLSRALDLFQEEYGEARHPLLKDPRVTVLAPFWRTVLEDLGIGVRAVIPVRHPLAVAGSLARRNAFATEKSVLLWSAYMLAAEAYTRDLPRAFVSYDGLLSDWRAEVGRIEAAHGAPLPNLTEKAGKAIDRFLTPELRHNAGAGDLAALGWAGELTAAVHGWFEAAATGAAPDRAPVERAAAELTRRRDEVGVLVSPTTRDLDATRAALRELRDELTARETVLLETLRSEREALESGWRADVERLQEEQIRERGVLEEGWRADITRLQAEQEQARAVMEAGWRADVERLQAEQQRDRVELETMRRRWFELSHRLDIILAES